MLKYYLVIFTVFLLCFTCNNNCSATVLTFEDAVKQLNEHSISLKIAQLTLEIAHLDFERASAANFLADLHSTRIQIESNIAKANNSFNSTKNNNYLEVLRKYTEVLSAERNLEIRLMEHKIAEHNLQVVKEKTLLGDVSNLDNLKELNRYESALRAVETARQSLAESLRFLQYLLSLEDSSHLELEFSFKAQEFSLDLNQCLKLALKNNFDLQEKSINLQLQEIQLKKMSLDGTPPLDLRKNELNLEISKLNYQKAQEDLQERVIASHQSLAQSWNRYLVSERELEIANGSFAISKREFELGLTTEIQLKEAQISLLKALGNKQDALTSYLISKIQFEQFIGLEVNGS